ncbi:MAG: hypothetical protein ACRD0G_03435 [Acidimicrobiales bacterium]
MLKRTFVLAAAALFVAMAASAAEAQEYPPTTPPGCADAGAALTLTGGNFTPGGAGSLSFSGAVVGCAYDGTVFSTPIDLPAKVADSSTLTFDFSVPADFTLGVIHSASITPGGSFRFCVTSSGAVAATSACAAAPAPALPRTGTDYVDDGIRAGAVAIGLGALLVLWRRRRVTATA